MSTFIVFGDSIAYGAWDSEGGWVQRLRRFLDSADSGDIVYNLGISGDTAGGVLERMKARGYRHESPLEMVKVCRAGAVDSERSLKELCKRCPECKKRIAERTDWKGF